ncbi:MAG: class I SAM-dependent methyltransferase [Proteobacteria bacterium]|nr:class I SAM-dependent methyltransferase [Pseudomonadota bacterium]
MKYPLSPRLRDFLRHLERAALEFRNKSPKNGRFYGFRLRFGEAESRLAKEWNRYYEAIVWGDQNDASNDRLRSDERRVIDRYLGESVHSGLVLEVGSGSGRVTEHLMRRAHRVIALDREEAPLDRLRARLQGAGMRHKPRGIDPVTLETLCADFAGSVLRIPKVDSVFLMENLAGMNPVFADRARIYRNAYACLKKHGIAVFAYRVDERLRGVSVLNQVMPYEVEESIPLFGEPVREIYGFALNWSRAALPAEVIKVCPGFEQVEIVEGNNRPAGGRMVYGIFRKMR